MRFSISLLFASLILAAAFLARGQAPEPTTAPAVNWVLPLFTDREGYRAMTLRGSSVKPADNGGIAVTDLNITIFSGDAAVRVDTVLLSQYAVFLPKENRAFGDKTVRVIRAEIDVTGEGWTYDQTGKKVSIRENVRVVYRAPLKLSL
ncbi:MAG: hypothetical protein EXS38_03045 [Opitutus sp.]|nr:hypothetical protein [Opitutus sp.]